MQDERKGTMAAQLFFEKGYENVYLISGGIDAFVEEFPQLCEGKEVPIPKKKLEEEKMKEKMEVTKRKHEHCLQPSP